MSKRNGRNEIFITGGTGFVGSNIIKVAIETRNAQVCTTTKYWTSSKAIPFKCTYVDLRDSLGLKEAVLAADPSVIIHAAIENDFEAIRADRRVGWESFVDSTRALSEAANELGVKLVLISTDWVFDGAQPFASESTPPNPINMYGVLKLASEMVVTNHTRQGAVARIAAVNGVHWLRPDFQSFQNTAWVI